MNDGLRLLDRIIDPHDDEWEVEHINRVDGEVGLRSTDFQTPAERKTVQGLTLPDGWSRA